MKVRRLLTHPRFWAPGSMLLSGFVMRSIIDGSRNWGTACLAGFVVTAVLIGIWEWLRGDEWPHPGEGRGS